MYEINKCRATVDTHQSCLFFTPFLISNFWNYLEPLNSAIYFNILLLNFRIRLKKNLLITKMSKNCS